MKTKSSPIKDKLRFVDTVVYLLNLGRSACVPRCISLNEDLYNFPVQENDGGIQVIYPCQVPLNPNLGLAKGGQSRETIDTVPSPKMWMLWKYAFANLPMDDGMEEDQTDSRNLSDWEQERFCWVWINL
jgi:glutamate dehydrogenase/leucine dehydrogenase